MEQIDRIGHLTYSLQHQPNCPKKYLIRLIGDQAGMIDNLPYSPYSREYTKDRLFFGKTLKEAIDKALADEMVARDRRLKKMNYIPKQALPV